MTRKKILAGCLLVAALATGAAITTSAQRRRAAPQRKTTAEPAATATPSQATGGPPAADSTTAEPAKKNARAPGDSNAAPPAGGDTASKKNDAPATAASNENAGASSAPNGPRYSYEFAQPAFDITHVRIEHDGSGRGTITFERRNEEQPFSEPVEISPTAFARIVAAWQALKFLDSREDYQSDKHFANLGVVRLSMKDGARERTAQFDWTNNEQAAALRREYQRLTDQKLFFFDMEVARQYQPSETVRILKRLEILLDQDGLSDPALIKPLLADLTNDERVPLIARNQAARLLKRIEKEKK